MPRKAGETPSGQQPIEQAIAKPDLFAQARLTFGKAALHYTSMSGDTVKAAYLNVSDSLQSLDLATFSQRLQDLIALAATGEKLFSQHDSGQYFAEEVQRLQVIAENLVGVQQPKTDKDVPPMTGAKGSPSRR